jgi:hypothetical protein
MGATNIQRFSSPVVHIHAENVGKQLDLQHGDTLPTGAGAFTVDGMVFYDDGRDQANGKPALVLESSLAALRVPGHTASTSMTVMGMFRVKDTPVTGGDHWVFNKDATKPATAP